jgi:hypothetical protein
LEGEFQTVNNKKGINIFNSTKLPSFSKEGWREATGWFEAISDVRFRISDKSLNNGFI